MDTDGIRGNHCNMPSGGGSREEWRILGGAESGDGWLDYLMTDCGAREGSSLTS